MDPSAYEADLVLPSPVSLPVPGLPDVTEVPKGGKRQMVESSF